MFLYHYYDKSTGPFKSISSLTVEEATAIIAAIAQKTPHSPRATQTPEAYVNRRHYIENLLKTEFGKKGGVIERHTPHYMTVEHSPWVSTSWYDDSAYIKIPIEEFDVKTISFTYGDAFPVFSDNKHKMDDAEFRRMVYTYDEILRIIEKYGLPQNWNEDGTHGPSRYVEAHVWSDETISKYRK